ncbi:alpha/beta hydrolase [Ktedonosporobacter rubrisoli]|uniref:Alpha/beta hydrolase n=1 Tax=Ktedonosporobacter rubrisoli TaxID=2509675 RepID=A0A4P6JRP0_KTERU|nr:alpha/beta hydrolase [Ktedonosporobacter rubrisoli]QBD78139.1 alpha/beta hydrolase [Ktedonosporobacter rubrisoli]
MNKAIQTYTKDTVISKDGTRIGYRQMGSGPGLILLHGGINASQHLMKLGTALADSFTVYIPDRRGRGMSGPFGSNYCIEREDEDLDALLQKTGAHYVFGTADGALFALHAAITLPAIHKIVAYEPVLFVGQSKLAEFEEIIQRYERQMARSNPAGAIVSVSRDGNQSPIINFIPDFLIVPFAEMLLSIEARTARGDNVPLKELIPTMHFEFQLVRQTEGTLENYRQVNAEVLLLFGGKSDALFKECITTLNSVLPHAKSVELEGLNHGSAQDYGKPELIAREIRRFLQEA